MALTHSASAASAARFAAQVLSADPSPGDELVVAQLQSDLANLLLETVVATTEIRVRTDATRASEVARHPVQQLTTCLASLSRLDRPADSGSPAVRWDGAPASPHAATTRVDMWKGLVVAMAGMSCAVSAQADQLSEDEQWRVMRTVGALVEVLALSRLGRVS